MTDLTDAERAILLDPCGCGHTLNDHGGFAGCWKCLDDEEDDWCQVTCEALIVERVGRIVAGRVSTALAAAADDWQTGGWTVITAAVTTRSVIGTAQIVTDWLRAALDGSPAGSGGEEAGR